MKRKINKILDQLEILNKHRGIILAITWTVVLAWSTFNDGYSLFQLLFIILATLPFCFLFQAKLFLGINIIFMSIFSFLSIPLLITFFIILFTQSVTLSLLITSICSVSLLIYLTLLFTHKFDDRFLDNAKISLDIIRTIFAVSLGFLTFYSLTHKDFSFFRYIIVDYNQKKPEDLKQILQILSQSIALPFVISTSTLKIITDIISLMKKRGKRLTWFSRYKYKNITPLASPIAASHPAKAELPSTLISRYRRGKSQKRPKRRNKRGLPKRF